MSAPVFSANAEGRQAQLEAERDGAGYEQLAELGANLRASIEAILSPLPLGDANLARREIERRRDLAIRCLEFIRATDARIVPCRQLPTMKDMPVTRGWLQGIGLCGRCARPISPGPNLVEETDHDSEVCRSCYSDAAVRREIARKATTV